jgi:hypothetical protein
VLSRTRRDGGCDEENYDRAGPERQRFGIGEDVRTRTHGYAGRDVRRLAKQGLEVGPCEIGWPQ